MRHSAVLHLHMPITCLSRKKKFLPVTAHIFDTREKIISMVSFVSWNTVKACISLSPSLSILESWISFNPLYTLYRTPISSPKILPKMISLDLNLNTLCVRFYYVMRFRSWHDNVYYNDFNFMIANWKHSISSITKTQWHLSFLKLRCCLQSY